MRVDASHDGFNMSNESDEDKNPMQANNQEEQEHSNRILRPNPNIFAPDDIPISEEILSDVQGTPIGTSARADSTIDESGHVSLETKTQNCKSGSKKHILSIVKKETSDNVAKEAPGNEMVDGGNDYRYEMEVKNEEKISPVKTDVAMHSNTGRDETGKESQV